MILVTLKDHRYSVPLSEVKLVEEDEGELVRLTMKDGSHFETFKYRWLMATKYQFQQVVPAAPGTFLICETEDEGYTPDQFEPVIGWAVHDAGGVLPLTHYGTPDDDDPHVLHPDGKVTSSGGGVYKTLAEYLASLKSYRDAAREA